MNSHSFPFNTEVSYLMSGIERRNLACVAQPLVDSVTLRENCSENVKMGCFLTKVCSLSNHGAMLGSLIREQISLAIYFSFIDNKAGFTLVCSEVKRGIRELPPGVP